MRHGSSRTSTGLARSNAALTRPSPTSFRPTRRRGQCARPRRTAASTAVAPGLSGRPLEFERAMLRPGRSHIQWTQRRARGDRDGLVSTAPASAKADAKWTSRWPTANPAAGLTSVTALCRLDDIGVPGSWGFSLGEGSARPEIFVVRDAGGVRAYVNSWPTPRRAARLGAREFLSLDRRRILRMPPTGRCSASTTAAVSTAPMRRQSPHARKLRSPIRRRRAARVRIAGLPERLSITNCP